jgi:hypothetical protein
MIYISKERSDVMADGSTCRGCDFVITVDSVAFKVRNSIDRPGEFTVISPKSAGKSPQVRQLVDYLVSVLGGAQILFYCEPDESYREVNLQTLEFVGFENGAAQHIPKPKKITHVVRTSRTRVFMPV